MSSDTEPTNPNSIDTTGGAVFDGAVNTGGGDFVGRDQTIHGDQVSGDKILGDKVLGDKTIVTEETAYNVHGLTNPYLGLRAFGYADRTIYAGREQLAQETVQRLTTPGAQQSILFITGASGSGKSSFAQAGLIPLLESHYAAYQKTVRHAIMRPSSQPMVMLADALQKLHPDLTPETLAINTPKAQINLLLIDQFEELFIQSDASQRAPFCKFLSNLPNFAACRTYILITLRVDYLDELFAIQPLWAIAKEGVELRTMSADDLRHAIQKPLQVNHPQKRFAPELLDRLVQDGGADAALLPLLQVTLAELWKTGKLVLSNYDSLTDAIRQRAEMVYAFSDHADADPKTPRLAQDQQELMSILLDLINVSVDGADRRDARQRRTRQELEQGSAHRSRLIEELVNARLLAAASEIRNGTDVEVIDIIHESLIDNWDRLRDAIEGQRQQLQRRARFKLWLGEWLRNGRQDGALLTDLQLAEARALVDVRDIEMQGVEPHDFYTRSWQYLEANRQRELENQRQRARIFRNAVIVAGLLFLLAAGAAGFSYYLNQQLDDKNQVLDQTNSKLGDTVSQLNQTVDDLDTTNTQLQQTISETQRLANLAFSRQLTAQATSELSKGRFETAILLAIEAGKITDTLESHSAMQSVIGHPVQSRILFYGHTGFVSHATWSKDESKILTNGEDGTARVWDATTGAEIVRFRGHTSSVTKASWSPDNSKILTTGTDGTTRIWDAKSGKELMQLIRVYGATWSPDNSKILTLGEDGAAHIWATESGKELARFITQSGYVQQAIWSKDGDQILTNSEDGRVKIWDVKSEKELIQIAGNVGYVYNATWNRDGRKILTSSNDGTARIWDAKNGREILTLIGHTGFVYHAQWNQNESNILTSGTDGTLRLWDAKNGNELVRLTVPKSSIWQAIWSQDESKILTSASDGTARIWDIKSGKELLRIVDVTEATWNRDEQKILTNSRDGTARIWDAQSGNEIVPFNKGTRTLWSQDGSKILIPNTDGTAYIRDIEKAKEDVQLVGHVGSISQASWNRDASKILTIDPYGSANIWDAKSGKPLVFLTAYSDYVNQITWSNDGRKILTSSNDGATRIWDAENGKQLVLFSTRIGFIYHATWSQDGNKILAGSGDGTAYIWDAKSGKELALLVGHTGSVLHASWSQDESKILTSGSDHTARIWDTKSGKELVRLVGHTDSVWQASWSQDESKILTSSGDNTARIWETKSGMELLRLVGHTNSVFQATWNHDKSKILTSGYDGTVRIWNAESGKEEKRIEVNAEYVDAVWSKNENKILTNDGIVRIWHTEMSDSLIAGCRLAPRNLNWSEWGAYVKDLLGSYRPTCPNAPIPPDAISGIQEEAHQQILAGQLLSGTQRLEELNGWLQVNGQFKNYGVDVAAFVVGVSATATALPPTAMPFSP